MTADEYDKWLSTLPDSDGWDVLRDGECLAKPWWNDGVYPTTAGRTVEVVDREHQGVRAMLVRAIGEG